MASMWNVPVGQLGSAAPLGAVFICADRPIMAEDRDSQSLTPHKTQIYPTFLFLIYQWNLRATVYGGTLS
jgi:hypothetical protein